MGWDERQWEKKSARWSKSHSGLSSDEFFCIARCKSAKEIWNMLEVTHEGTMGMRRSRKHTLVSKYEAFWMKNGETILEHQTRFTHIVNHLLGLGKMFNDEEMNLKNLGTEDYNNQGIQESSYNDDGSSLR